MPIIETAIEIVSKHIKFQPILQCEESLQTKLKTIVFSDINLKLFQEINKVNLNYSVEFNSNFCNEKNDVEFFGKVERIYDFNKNNISYFLQSNKTQKAKIYLKLENFCYNLKTTKKGILLEFPNGKTIEYVTNSNIIKTERLNVNGTNYLIVQLSVLKNVETYLTSDLSFVSKKQAMLKEKFEFLNLFGVKIYTKNKEFNSFFNSLPDKIFKEFKEKNFVTKPKVEQNEKLFFEMFGTKELKFETYLEMYNHLLKEVFGIEIYRNKLFANPKINLDFKIVLNNGNVEKSVYVSRKGKTELVVNGVVFSNIPFVDLNLIEKTAFLCVWIVI